MTDRKEKLAVLADYAEELGLAGVAEAMRRKDFPTNLVGVLALHRQRTLEQLIMLGIADGI